MSDSLWQLWCDESVQRALLVALLTIICVGVVLRWAGPALLPWAVAWAWPAVKLGALSGDAQALALLNASILGPLAVGVCVADPERSRRTTMVLLASALVALACVLAAVGFHAHWRSDWPPRVSRWAGGVALSSNHLGSALAFGMVVTAVAAARRKRRAAGVVLWAFAVLQLGLVLLTGSRGALLAGVGGVIIGALCVRTARRSRVLLTALAVLAVAGAVTYAPIRSRFDQLRAGMRPSSATNVLRRFGAGHPERSASARATANDVAEALLGGVEPAAMFAGVQVKLPDGEVRRFSGSYCTHLNWARRFGVPSTVASACLLIVSAACGMRSTDMRVAASAVGCVTLLLHSFVTDIWQHPLIVFIQCTLSLLLWVDWLKSRRARLC